LRLVKLSQSPLPVRLVAHSILCIFSVSFISLPPQNFEFRIVSGVAAVFTVTAVDIEGSTRSGSSDGFVVSIARSDASIQSAARYETSNIGNGIYALSFVATASGSYQISIRLGGVWQIKESP
jgi:hypothetical protein